MGFYDNSVSKLDRAMLIATKCLLLKINKAFFYLLLRIKLPYLITNPK